MKIRFNTGTVQSTVHNCTQTALRHLIYTLFSVGLMIPDAKSQLHKCIGKQQQANGIINDAKY